MKKATKKKPIKAVAKKAGVAVGKKKGHKLSPNTVKAEQLKAIERRLEKTSGSANGKKKSKKEIALEQQISSLVGQRYKGAK